MTQTSNKPVKKIQAGGISAAIWKNDMQVRDGRQVESSSVSIERRYKDKRGEWQSTSSLQMNDVPKALLVLNKAYEYMALKDRETEIPDGGEV